MLGLPARRRRAGHHAPSRMARSVRHLTEVAALLAEREVDLVVLKQGIDTSLFHVIGAMDEMLADLISEGTL